MLAQRLRERGYDHQVINAGVSGETTAGTRRRLEWVLRNHPTLVILVIGANDGLRGLPLEQMEENIDHILSHLREKGVRVLLGGMQIPPNYGDTYTQAFAAIYPRLAARHAVPLIPFFLAGVAGKRDLNQDDGIHPNPRGYVTVLDTVWAVLEGVLARAPGP